MAFVPTTQEMSAEIAAPENPDEAPPPAALRGKAGGPSKSGPKAQAAVRMFQVASVDRDGSKSVDPTGK